MIAPTKRNRLHGVLAGDPVQPAAKPNGDPIRPPRAHAPDERWQHGADPVVVDGQQRVQRPVDALRAKGSIGDAEVQAASRYYEDYAFGVHGAEIEQRGGSGGGVDGYSIAQIEALGRYQDVRRALGTYKFGLLNAVVIDELSIRNIAGPKTVARAKKAVEVSALLKELAGVYSKLDGAKPGKPSPIRATIVDLWATN